MWVDEQPRLVMLSAVVWLDPDPDGANEVRHVPPGQDDSGWHVGSGVFMAILRNAGSWCPEAPPE